ncbi:MAG: aminoacyl-tRNA hydrolase [Bacteroidota bacterium]
MKHLIIGLGNLGPEYTATRHNIGFMLVDQLAAAQGVSFRPERLAAMATCKYRGRTLYLAKPSTYMNHSGRAVRYWLQQLKIPVEKSLVIVDDIALPFGKLRMRARGAAAGHNGLKDIEAQLSTQAYPRLRFGIGNDFHPGQQAAYVLEQFTDQEQAALATPLAQACKMVYAFCTLGIERTMNQYNQ